MKSLYFDISPPSTLVALLACVAVFGTLTLPASAANWQFVSLYSFTNGADGDMPQGGLTQASDGNFYGVTLEGGEDGSGTIFNVNADGVLAVVYTFTGQDDGGNPHAGLVQANDGLLYGTTIVGGTNNTGTVFSISTNLDFATVYTFSSSGETDGDIPNAPLIQGTDGYLYGTTSAGGVNFLGNVFRITTNGVITNLFSFTGGPDGDEPMSPLVQATDGNLYGTCQYGGTNNQGAIFRITTNGLLTPLYSFSAAPNLTNEDGTQPLGGLVQGRDGSLYGVTSSGGTDNGGTIYHITTNGSFAVILQLNIDTEGGQSSASLILGTDGNLYGTTVFGGPEGNGSAFQVTTNGVLTTLYAFVGGSFDDGSGVGGPLLQGSDGNMYGAASGSGGAAQAGAIFELINPANASPMLTLISLLPAYATIKIQGQSQLTYQVQASEDLISWSQIGDVTIPDGGSTNFLDTNASQHSYRFYRTVYP